MNPNEVRYIVIHCSATRVGQDFRAIDIDSWHRRRGFKKIGYHYVVDLDGTIEDGRKLDEEGAHVWGYNNCSVGVCYIGGLDANGKPKDTRTLEQKGALLALLRELKRQYPKALVVGHRDLNPMKGCPCFDAVKEYSQVISYQK